MKRTDNEIMRLRILDAVIECKIHAEGAYVSLSQISCKAGISERTLNRYFPDKEIMIYGAAVRYLKRKYDEFSEQYRACDKKELNGLECLMLLVKLQMDNYMNSITDALIFVRAYTTTLNTAVYRKLPVAGYDASAREIVLECIRNGVKDGSIKHDAVPMDAYLLISSNFNGLVQRLIYTYSVEYSAEEHRKELFNVFGKYIQMLRVFLSA